MERKINNLSICYTLFLILLFLSGSLPGLISGAVRLLAFLIPFGLGLMYLREEENTGEKYLFLSTNNLKFTLPLAFPTVLVVMLISALTSIIIKLASGVENNVDVGNALIPALISHALVPAVFEEILFRYLPMRLLSSYSRRVTVLVSALFFALVHHDFFSIPYAFIAGIVFMTVDLASDSILPSVLIHFINNALSVSLVMFKDNPLVAPAILWALGIMTVVSFIFIIIKRHRYKQILLFAFSGGEKLTFNFEMLVFSVITLFMAVLQLL